MLYTDEAIYKRKKREARIKKQITIWIYILLMPLLIYNVSLIVQAILIPDKTPSFLGIKTYVIVSGSMQPALEIGDIVIVKEEPPEQLHVNDIISFRQGQSVITHRIIEKNDTKQYRTKGDYNNAEDHQLVHYQQVEGKVVAVIPKIGNITIFMQGKMVLISIVILFYIYLCYTGKRQKIKRERKEKRLAHERKKQMYM